jgi:hydrogenase maturation protease
MADNGRQVGVIGIGNLLLRDEGLGVHALRALEQRDLPGEVKLIDGGTDPWSALTALDGCEALIVLDAVVGGKQPGELHRLGLDDVDARGAAMSLHGVTLFHLLRYEQLVGNGFGEVHVLGMEPAEVAPGIGLSEPCAARLPEFLEAVLQSVECLQQP